MRPKKGQLERIVRYELMFDHISETVNRLNAAIEEFEKLSGEIDELNAYYTGKDWKRDFTDDEAGRLPDDLKRGVLSEDGVYDLMSDVDELRSRIAPENVEE